jgi:hypothetical protein
MCEDYQQQSEVDDLDMTFCSIRNVIALNTALKQTTLRMLSYTETCDFQIYLPNRNPFTNQYAVVHE